MNVSRVIVNFGKIAANAAWKKLAGRFLFPFDCLEILQKNFAKGDRFTVIQIGANDGVSNDFLYDFVTARKPVGLVIEPVKEYFDQLVFHYRNFPDVIPVNLAIHATDTKLELFKVKSESLQKLPGWANGIASARADHHLSSGIGKEHMQRVVVEADSLMNIIKPYSYLYNSDYVQIDVEGFDDEVLKQIDFAVLKPKIIRFEYMNLEEQKTVNAIRLLKQHGYYCYYEAMDVVALQPKEIVL